ncbi:F-box protein [Canna indica]|uniref:F-box protein n=1 Tax=Canna indica TaxID=4628 RepID=A0AAQ3Q0L6_9LILI|nr:F-box protein [Canna indica]
MSIPCLPRDRRSSPPATEQNSSWEPPFILTPYSVPALQGGSISTRVTRRASRAAATGVWSCPSPASPRSRHGSDASHHPRFRRWSTVMESVVPKRRPPLPSADPPSSDASASPPRVHPGSAAMDRVLESILALPDPFVALELSLERLLDSILLEAEKDRLVDNAMEAGSALLEAAKRSARRRASKHNSYSWPLPSDLTIKVFSKLDTQSLCHAAASCSMFNKCATDPMCYENIDLIAEVPKVNNTVVSTMIQRAGKRLQSLKLGIRPTSASTTELSRPLYYSTRNPMDSSGLSWSQKRPRQGKETSLLTRSCLLALSVDDGAAGTLLRRLHLYNIEKMDTSALHTALSACPCLLDLEVVGLHVELRRTLDAVSTNCHHLERLLFESSDSGRDDSLNTSTCNDLVNGCPNLKSLGLRGFKLHDQKVRILVKGFHHLNFVDFSTSYSITGAFLRNLGGGTNAYPLEVLILRDCLHLKEVEVSHLLSAMLAGDFKLLRYLDISNKDGLSADNDWNYRCYNPCTLLISQVLKQRPELCVLAKFPQEGSLVDIDLISDGELSSGASSPRFYSLPLDSLDSYLAISSENSYSSDQGSGNEDIPDLNFPLYDVDSFDELEFP